MTRTQQATGSSSECKFHGGGALRCACRSDGRSSRDNARDHQFLHAQPLQPICGDHLPCGAHLVVMLGRVQSVDSECLRYAAVFVTQLIPVRSAIPQERAGPSTRATVSIGHLCALSPHRLQSGGRTFSPTSIDNFNRSPPAVHANNCPQTHTRAGTARGGAALAALAILRATSEPAARCITKPCHPRH